MSEAAFAGNRYANVELHVRGPGYQTARGFVFRPCASTETFEQAIDVCANELLDVLGAILSHVCPSQAPVMGASPSLRRDILLATLDLHKISIKR